VELVRADERFGAAWLEGSIARGDADALSDVDLHLVVTDEAAATLCARPWTLAGYTTAERAALFSHFGQPVIIHENHHNAPPNGSFTTVIYASLLTVDWVLVPQATAARPPDASLLFDRIGLPTQHASPPLSPTQRAERASERVAFFWMMMSITVKHLLRGNVVRVNHNLAGLEPLLREVQALVMDVPVPFTTRSSFALAVTVEEQVGVVRQFCEAILHLSPAIVALGGYVPDQPMAIIDGLLALVTTQVDTRR
jgi:hypothetical protein